MYNVKSKMTLNLKIKKDLKKIKSLYLLLSDLFFQILNVFFELFIDFRNISNRVASVHHS